MSNLADLIKMQDQLRELEAQMQQTLTILEKQVLHTQILLGETIKMRQQVDALHKQALAQVPA